MKVYKRFRDECKVLKVIESCLTLDHLNIARKMIYNYCKMYKINFVHSGLYRLFIVKSTNILVKPVINE